MRVYLFLTLLRSLPRTSFLCLASCFLTLLECEQQNFRKRMCKQDSISTFCLGVRLGHRDLPAFHCRKETDQVNRMEDSLLRARQPVASAQVTDKKLMDKQQTTASCCPAQHRAQALQKQFTQSIFNALSFFSHSFSHCINVTSFESASQA